MQTIQIKVEYSFYQDMLKSNIVIKSELKKND
jgi:hypothetical protein